MAQPDRLIFYTGAPGSKWSAVSHIITKNPRLPIDASDYDPVARHYRGNGLDIGHNGAYFGPGNGIGERFHELDQLSREEILAEIDRGWPVPQGEGWRIVKCHHFVDHLDYIADTFPESAIMIVMRPEVNCWHGWMRAGGFSITYPDYHQYYINEERIKREITREGLVAREWVGQRDLPLHVVRPSYWREVWDLGRDHSEEIDRYMRSIELRSNIDGTGMVPSFDTWVAHYNLPGLK